MYDNINSSLPFMNRLLEKKLEIYTIHKGLQFK